MKTDSPEFRAMLANAVGSVTQAVAVFERATGHVLTDIQLIDHDVSQIGPSGRRVVREVALYYRAPDPEPPSAPAGQPKGR